MEENYSVLIASVPNQQMPTSDVLGLFRSGDYPMLKLDEEEHCIISKSIEAESSLGAAMIAFGELDEDFERSRFSISAILRAECRAKSDLTATNTGWDKVGENHTVEVVKMFD